MRLFRKKFKDEQSAQMGFTLVELIVVLALMSILMSISIFGAVAWIDWVNFQQEDSYAEDIFFAAQNQLTELESSGALDRKLTDALWDKSTNKYKTNYVIAQGKAQASGFTGFIKTNGDEYKWEEIWLDSNIEKEKRTLISLRVGPNRYTEYIKASHGDLTQGEVLLFDLIASRISDKKVLNGSIALEFSPEAGQVFAVCYSDRGQYFTYSETPGDGEVDIRDRSLPTREAAMIGYYGVDNLTLKLNGRNKSTDEYRFEIQNGGVLSLILSPKSNSTELITDTKLLYTISGSHNYVGPYSPVMAFAIETSEIPSLARSLQKATENPMKVAVTLYEGLYINTTQYFMIPVWVDDYGRINVVLDAADIQAQSVTYANSFGLLSEDTNVKESAQEAFRNTFSFYRFGLYNTRYIRAKVDLSRGAIGVGESGRYTELVFEKYGDEDGMIRGEAVTFANWDDSDHVDDDTDNIYGIRNGRHLYNVRFESDYSDELKNKGFIDRDAERRYILKDDIDWKYFLGITGDNNIGNEGQSSQEPLETPTNYLFNSYYSGDLDSPEKYVAGIDLYPDDSVEVLSYLYGEQPKSYYGTDVLPFPGFRMLSGTDSFTSNDGNHRISGLDISLAANCIYGVYGESIQADIKAKKYDEISLMGKAGLLPLGLFAENRGSISNIELDSIKVSGVEGYPVNQPSPQYLFTSKVGGFVGENFGSVSNLYIDVYEYDSIPDEKRSYVRGRSDVGGIVGHQYYILKLKNNANSSTTPAGTGNESSTEDDPYASASMTISSCINNAKVTGIGYVGGIIGRIYTSKGTEYGKVAFDIRYTIDGLINSIPFSDNHFAIDTSEYTLTAIQKFTIDNCKNHGEITMDSYFAENVIDNDTLKRGFYFGGITGAAFNVYKTNNAIDMSISYDNTAVLSRQVIISNCESYTLYSTDELNSILKPGTDNQKIKQAAVRMRANFVGGIVGGARYAFIENCSTTPESGYSFVFGDRYVGGIAGYLFETSISGGTQYTTAEIDKLNNNTKNNSTNNSATIDTDNYRNDYSIINGTNVVGNYAVGGIAGVFGTPDGISQNNRQEFVGEIIERCYGSYNGTSFSEYLQWPVNCAQVSGPKCSYTGLLNSALVLGLSFNSNVNKYIYNGKMDMISCYGVGGIAGISRTSMANADYIQTNDMKIKLLQYAGFSNVSTVSGKLNNISASAVQDVINSSEFATDGVGGLVGEALEYGDINKANGDTKYDSRIDAIIFGRNRVGGAVGDTTATSNVGGRSRIANCILIKNGSSSGVYVLGKDNVGGVIGVYSDNGGNGSDPGLNDERDLPNDYFKYNNGPISNDGAITKPYYVIGDRSVGGYIGTFYAKASDGDRRVNIKILPDSGEVIIKGSMYVGGIVGLQEEVPNGSDAKYYIQAKSVKITADCYAGCLVGAMYGSMYWPVDKLAVYDNSANHVRKSYVLKMTLTAEVAAAFVTGLYAVNTDTPPVENGIKSVLLSDTGKDENTNYAPELSNGEYLSRNGLYSSSLKDYHFKITSSGYKGFADDMKEKFKVPATANKITMDLTYLSNNVQEGGNNNSSVTAGIYTGGLFGFVPKDTQITVRGYRNRAKLYTKRSIQAQEISTQDTNWYSYLGAVTGKIPCGMEVIGCKNTSQHNNYNSDNAKASFLGGITEVNAGYIRDCGTEIDSDTGETIFDMFEGSSITQENKYGGIGGVAGLNGTSETNVSKKTGVIYNCANTYTMSGNTAGGIAAAAGGDSAIIGCINHGECNSKVTGPNGGAVAGILCKVLASDAQIILDDNVNTGLMRIDKAKSSESDQYNTEYAAGIVYDSLGKGEITLCRNYAPGLKYAITAKPAKYIRYCLDASDTTEKSTDHYSGFFADNKINNTEDDRENNYTNFYLGRKNLRDEEGLGTAAHTNDLTANSFYSTITYYSGKNQIEAYENNNTAVSSLTGLVSDLSDDDLVQRSYTGFDSSQNGDKLTFEIRAVDSSHGRTNNMYTDMDSFTVVWDNIPKAEQVVIDQESNETETQYTYGNTDIKYCLLFVDVNGYALSISNIQTSLSADQYKAESFSLADLVAGTIPEGAGSYKDEKFDKDRINRVGLVVTDFISDIGVTKIGIRALGWALTGTADDNYWVSVSNSDPYVKADSRKNTIQVLTDNKVTLQKLYFEDVDSQNANPDIYLFGFSTGAENIDINTYIYNKNTININSGKQKKLIDNSKKPYYFSDLYLNDRADFLRGNVVEPNKNDNKPIFRYIFSRKVDDYYMDMLKECGIVPRSIWEN